MENNYQDLLNHLLTTLNEKDTQDLKAFYSFYKKNEDQLTAYVDEAMQNHSKVSNLELKQPNEAITAQNHNHRELRYDAIFNNQWGPYIKNRAEQGAIYARMGIDFYVWFDLLAMIRNHITPMVLLEYQNEPDTIQSILKGTNRFLDISMCSMAEAYLNEEKKIVEEQKNEQKKINKQLKRTVSIIKEKNQELEQFAYVASHDLQEPLRMVTSFLTQLSKKYNDQLDEKAHKYIHYAVDGAARMRIIILDLLEFSRVGRNEHDYENVKMNELLQEAIQLNQKVIDEKETVVQYDDLPEIHASKTPLRQVLQNLIGNALKYHNDDEKPVIKISSSETATHWQFALSDNGIGIAPEYYDKIFLLFQRLHGKEEYSGTGIGLALCKKIIENHNGHIWVESEPGKGSTFYFTIDKEL